MTFFTLLGRLLKRSGVRLLLSWSSLIIGALTLAVVLGLIGSVQKFFISESRTLLGGDVSIESNSKISIASSSLQTLRSKGATFSERIDTLVVVQTGKSATEGKLSNLLVSLKVVDQEYPLYGKFGLQVSGSKTPTAAEVFIAKDILVRMGVVVGDMLTIGNEQFTIANVIESEPDGVGGSFRLGPLIVISTEGWERTKLGGKQSRIEYTLSVRYPQSFTSVESAEATLAVNAEFTRPLFRVGVASDGPRSLLRVLDSAQRFFFSMIVLALFLVVVNIRLNLTYFLSGFQKTIAIMRSLGMQRSQLFALFLSLLLFMAFSAGVLGALLGNILANTALPFAAKYVGSTLPFVSPLENMLVITLFTFMLCLFSALGFLSRVLGIEPKMLLLGYGRAHGKFAQLKKELPTLLLTLVGFYLGVFFLTQRVTVSLIAVGSVTGIFILLFLFSRGGILLGYRARFTLPFSLRAIMNFLKQQGLIATTAIASLTIALASVLAIALLEKNVLGNLQSEFKSNAPNIYLIDVQNDQLEGVRSIMGTSWRDFSVVRARFTLRDGYDIQANLATEDGELGREFNVTGGAELIDGERLLSGVWHGGNGKKQVSIEKDFAARAKLSLGSKVTFAVQGFPIEATVTSIREVTTTSGLPFFFLVFSPDVLEGIPRTSFGYAYASPAEIPLLQNSLASRYPNITSIPTTQILETAAKIIAALSAAVVATTIPALCLGLLLIIAMLAISARERANDMLVFTAFGATTGQLFTLFVIESSAVVVISGIFALLISHVGVYALNIFVFDFNGFYFSPANGYLLLGIFVVTILIALLFARRFTALSPAELLRKKG